MRLFGKKSKPRLITFLSKTYDPGQIDGQLSMFAKAPNAIQVQVTKPLDLARCGRITVDGVDISKPTQVLIPMSPLPILMIPVGEVAVEYDSEYTVRCEGFYDFDGNRMDETSFQFKTKPKPAVGEGYAAHDTVALEAAREGMVLLKNEEGLLPLRSNSVLNVFGAAQNMFRLTAWGAGLINPRQKPSFIQAVQDHSFFSLNPALRALYANRQEQVPSDEMLEGAKALNDTAIILLTRGSGENLDNRPIKGEYYLTDTEMEMIEAVTSVFDKTVLILNTGYPIDLQWLKKYPISSILYTGFPGMLGAYALIEILDGRTNPSGKLPDTWSWDYYDAPTSKNFINFTEEDIVPMEAQKAAKLYYEEDIYIGYRYFDTFHQDVAFGFGHGLSYTNFEVLCQTCSRNGQLITIDLSVTNTGTTAGKETVQVYVHAPDGKLEKPERVLAAFEKTRLLAPGETQQLHIEIEPREFASYDEENATWIVEAGSYRVDLGNSLTASQPVYSFELEQTVTLQQCQHLGAPVEAFNRLTKDNPVIDGHNSRLLEYQSDFGKHGKKIAYQQAELAGYSGRKITFEMLKNDPGLLNHFVAQMSDKELCRLNVCGGANWAPWQDGTAGRISSLKKYKMPFFVMSDGNAGVNIKKPNIGFPSSNTVCATFNKELAYAVGKVIAEESLENGIRLNLGPAMNIHRNILNGRHPEYFSEDPYLAGVMAGHHGKGLEENGVSCCYKHFCANNSETVRKASESVVSERALREIYFKVFEVAFAVHQPDSVMTSYNSVNGIYPAENPELLNQLLRDEFSFEGFIMTDWNTYDTVDPVAMAAAGNALITPGGKNNQFVKPLVRAVRENRLSRGVLQSNVRSIIRVMLSRIG